MKASATLLPLEEMGIDEGAPVDGLAFDVDDTVTRDGKLEAIAFQAMWALRRAGLALVALTGRPLGYCEVMARHWPIDLAVGENGAGWVSMRDGVLERGYFQAEEERARSRGILEGIDRAVKRELGHLVHADDQGARVCDLAFDVGERHEVDAATIDRLRAIAAREGARVFVSSVHAHVSVGDFDKARGVARAVQAVLGVEEGALRSRFVFVGDSPNDAPAFAFFERSVGVVNVMEHLDRLEVAPRFVTSMARGEGFAELGRFILARRPTKAPGPR